ncbi:MULTISPECIES: PIN domain-containing protein [Phyllobacteriaceae]|uniref:Ribonuclease VapC n=1 Tax=Ollibium composti TaxID=2675109 RepID=A0ABY2Q9A9_9HYPH|nr:MULTISPECIES: PIN domain-containing protein [Mesorhizobium]QDC00595.1 type II toxin-antitoxin system VapC family toxin [Mesorhizobium sp. 8]THF57929.1 type II toxin-antitoxin system VapC family toxin [Mesorhizobium composti]
MTLYLLDTNAVSNLADEPAGPIARHIGKVGPENVATSIIVNGEIEFGLELKQSKRLRAQMEQVFSVLPILPFEYPADRHYGALRAELKRRGRPIGPNDLLIAAHALALDATLVTANVGEFSRVPGLKIENWLRSQP